MGRGHYRAARGRSNLPYPRGRGRMGRIKELKHLGALTVLSAVVAVAPAHAASSATRARTVEEVAPGVHLIRHPDAPDEFPQSNTTVVIGERAVLVVDSCYLPSAAREDIAEIKRWTDKPVRYVVNTHWHYDHQMGNVAYRDAFPGVSILAHSGDAQPDRGLRPRLVRPLPRPRAAVPEAARRRQGQRRPRALRQRQEDVPRRARGARPRGEGVRRARPARGGADAGRDVRGGAVGRPRRAGGGGALPRPRQHRRRHRRVAAEGARAGRGRPGRAPGPLSRRRVPGGFRTHARPRGRARPAADRARPRRAAARDRVPADDRGVPGGRERAGERCPIYAWATARATWRTSRRRSRARSTSPAGAERFAGDDPDSRDTSTASASRASSARRTRVSQGALAAQGTSCFS